MWATQGVIYSNDLCQLSQGGLPDETASVASVSGSETSYVSRSTGLTGTVSSQSPISARKRARTRSLLVAPAPICVPEVQEKTHTKM